METDHSSFNVLETHEGKFELWIGLRSDLRTKIVHSCSIRYYDLMHSGVRKVVESETKNVTRDGYFLANAVFEANDIELQILNAIDAQE